MNDHKNEIGNLFNLLVQVLLCSNTANNNGGNGNSPTGTSQRSGALSAEEMAASVGSLATVGLPGARSGLVGVDLQQVLPRQQQQPQQSQQQQQSTASTANRGNV